MKLLANPDLKCAVMFLGALALAVASCLPQLATAAPTLLAMATGLFGWALPSPRQMGQ